MSLKKYQSHCNTVPPGRWCTPYLGTILWYTPICVISCALKKNAINPCLVIMTKQLSRSILRNTASLKPSLPTVSAVYYQTIFRAIPIVGHFCMFINHQNLVFSSLTVNINRVFHKTDKQNRDRGYLYL